MPWSGSPGRQSITYDYDVDGLVTRGGALTLKRDPVTGAITGDTIGVVATSRTYDDHGTLSGIELRVQGRITWSQRLTRDSLGRITVQRGFGRNDRRGGDGLPLRRAGPVGPGDDERRRGPGVHVRCRGEPDDGDDERGARGGDVRGR